MTPVGPTGSGAGYGGYGIHLVRELAEIDRADASVLVILRRRLHFYRTKYEIWLWMMAGTAYLLQFAINTMVDNQDGQYRINHPGIFIGVSIGILLFIYGVMKIAQYPAVREVKAILSDLENQVIESTEKIAVLKRTWRLWSVLFTVVLILLLIWGILKAISMV